MKTFNAVTSAIFGFLLAPFEGSLAWISVLLWSVLFGIVALVIYKYVSNQKGIERAKTAIKVHLLEIRLFKDDIVNVISSTVKILFKNALYIGHNLMPMVVMLIPVVAILAQLVAHYGYEPLPVGDTQILAVKLDRETTDLDVADLSLTVPAGVVIEDRVRTRPTGEVYWRLRFEEPGDHELQIHCGDRTLTKGVAVGGEPRKVPVKRTKSWEGFLYPGEPGLDADAPIYSAEFVTAGYSSAPLGVLPEGEGGILITFLVLSLVAGFALKGVFGVTL